MEYHASDAFYEGITLRGYSFHISDFVEWNLGYRIKWTNNPE
ncbi:hypothetical protein [Cryomorpha ignava]|nr:hypothetical protein [Cryomorpha ignava]